MAPLRSLHHPKHYTTSFMDSINSFHRPTRYGNSIYHKHFNCVIHVGAFVLIKGSKVYSYNLSTSQREVIKEYPNYVARVHDIKEDGEVVVYPYEPMYDDKKRPYIETINNTCHPIKSSPGNTLTELLELPTQEPHIIGDPMTMIIGFPFVFSQQNMKQLNLCWVTGMDSAYVVRYRYCHVPHLEFEHGYSTVEDHCTFDCHLRDDWNAPCATLKIYRGMHAIYGSIQRVLNLHWNDNGKFDITVDRSRYSHNLAWRMFYYKCTGNGMEPTKDNSHYSKRMKNLWNTRSKKKMGRPAQVFSFETQEHISILHGLLGTMVTLRKLDDNHMTDLEKSTVNEDMMAGTERCISIGYDGITLKVSCALLSVLSRDKNKESVNDGDTDFDTHGLKLAMGLVVDGAKSKKRVIDNVLQDGAIVDEYGEDEILSNSVYYTIGYTTKM
jgi:hypothetical protein